MNVRLCSVSIIGSLVFLSSAGSVMAFTTPTFPNCTSPQGTMKVHYDSGTHGIVGDTNTYQGKDTVYQLNEDALTQCFCPNSGQGIQTNWWKTASLNEEDSTILQKEGWILVPDGSLWGLDPVVYLAKNSPFSCDNDPDSTGGGTGNAQSANTSQSSGDVLGLAATGTISQIMLMCAIGSLLITLGLILKKRKS